MAVTDELVHKTTEIIGQLQGLAPKATGLAVETARMEGYAALAEGVMMVGLFAGTIWFWKKIFWPWAAEDHDGFEALVAIVLGIWTLLLFGGILFDLADPWNYIATVHPDLYLVHKMMSAIGK